MDVEGLKSLFNILCLQCDYIDNFEEFGLGDGFLLYEGLHHDLLMFSIYLFEEDGIIKEEDAKLISEICGISYSPEDLVELMEDTEIESGDYVNNLSLTTISITKFDIRNDQIDKKSGKKTPNIIPVVLSFYEKLGNYYATCKGDLDSKVKSKLDLFLEGQKAILKKHVEVKERKYPFEDGYVEYILDNEEYEYYDDEDDGKNDKNDISEIKKVLDMIYKHCDNIDSVKGCGDKPLREKFLLDTARFLMYLSASDGKIVPQERDMMNYFLDISFNIKDYVELIEDTDIYSVDFENHIPESLIEIAMFDHDLDQMEKETGDSYVNIIPLVFELYFSMGKCLIECDGEVDDQELEDLNIYINKKKLALEDYVETEEIVNSIRLSPKKK